MKRLIGILTVAFLGGTLLWSASPASAGWGFEDPQLCVNGQLLTIYPASPDTVKVKVPTGTQVDFDVTTCGGTELPISQNHVRYYDNVSLNKLKVIVSTDPGTVITFVYNGQTIVKSDLDGEVTARFDLP